LKIVRWQEVKLIYSRLRKNRDMTDDNKRILPGDILKVLMTNLLFVTPVVFVDPLIATVMGGGFFWVKVSEGVGQRLVLRHGMLLPFIITFFILFVTSIVFYSKISGILLGEFGFKFPCDIKNTLMIGIIGGVGLMLLGDFLETLILPLYEYFGITSSHLEISAAFGKSVSGQSLFYTAVIILSVGAVLPIIEEIFFRGIVHTAFQNKKGFKTAVLVSSLVFALAHLDLTVLPILFILGAVLAYVYYKTESLLAPALMHMTNNTLVFLLYMKGIERIFPLFYQLI